ncbi:LacI family DNA-binding transcriptional regulator [Nonomuraea aridisoli]|uniref:LacI family transcriptional regulator n=1 Tax=Nonomuraea aridisoli TaxID=2070368 RepID=A0A2W2E4S2_9ACTN|nr:LacI family DNA-binding transcriptional regulator [Nonomuraea aridisoli]PZG19296.1 LacI family transcriptional regulator [Nonomuraea aridisoli]
MNAPRLITLRDVARAAGVSTTTVSDALSGRGRLPAATRERVAAIARDLGYVANRSARNLRSGRTGAIGLYFPERTIGLEYYMDVAMGAAEEALAHDLALTLIPATRGLGRTPSLHLDGVVVSDPVLGDPMLQTLTGLGVPVVTCERDLTPGARHAGRIESDHVAGTRTLLDHLAHHSTQIALLCPGEETSFGLDVRVAYQAWCAETGRKPLIYDVPLVCEPQDVSRAVAEALRAPGGVDAIISVPDGGANSAVQAAFQHGRHVPGDLLVASYVDSPSLRGLPLPITAIDIAPREMGRRAAKMLADLLAGTIAAGAVEVLPLELMVRASTSPTTGR